MATAPLAVQAHVGPGHRAPAARPSWAPWPHGPHATYLDEARTHQVLAHVLPDGPGFRFVTREAPYAAPGAAPVAWVESVARFRDAWEAKFHVADLEGRLASIGRYWRQEQGRPGWTPVHRNPATPRVDLRCLDLGGPVPGASFHPFHHAGEGRDRLLVALPRKGAGAGSWALAALEFAYPRVEEGRLGLVHAALPAPVLRSVLAREHIAARQGGFEKLTQPAEFALAYGPTWRERLLRTFEAVVTRIATWRPPEAEDAPAQAPSPEGVADLDYASALAHPRLLDLHRRFLKPGEEQALMRAGVPAIRRAVAAKRRAAAHSDQHRLSALEASLLVRHAVASKTPVDPEAARLLRRLDLVL